MSTKIELEYPYCEDWKIGYLVTNGDNRKTVLLYNSHNDRSSTQYARYLMAVKLKRYLREDETVDHIDNDKTNDCVENLQILSRADNTRKTQKKADYKCVCPICGKEFVVPRRRASGAKKREQILSGKRCCSRKCANAVRGKRNI